MELAGEPGIRDVTDTLVGSVVHIDEQLAPVVPQCSAIHRIAMILRSDVTTVSAYLAYGLIMGAMSVFQLVDGGTSGLRQQLVTHTDTTDGLAAP